jgi:hypothetical protein
MLCANLEIGMHEQTRLQPEIRAALDAPYETVQDLDRRTMRALMPAWRRRVPRAVLAVADIVANAAQREIADMTREIITRSLMVMSLPGRELSLGADMDEPFPDMLLELRDPDLVALTGRFEPVAPAPDVTGASDWSDFDERMHYISHFFRAFHLHEELLGPPFTPEQVQLIAAGKIPGGEI